MSSFREVDEAALARAVPNLICYVQLEQENCFVVYEYERKANDVGVNCFWLDYDNISGNRIPMGDMGRVIFGAVVRGSTTDVLTKHCMIPAMPEKPLELHLRPDNRVIAKVLLKKKRCRPKRVLVNVNRTLKDISKVTIQGIHKKNGVEIPVEESIVPSADLKANLRKQITGF
jgi:hypothetical protein